MLVKINKDNHLVHLNLLQAYEAEFSAITKKLPNEEGKFELDTIWGGNIHGYLWFENNNPIGFILIDLSSEPFNVNEFYIVPSFRDKKLGQKFFFEVLDKHHGRWQVKQISGAIKATSFWRKAISEYTNNVFTEETYDDIYWGKVTRQLFSTSSRDKIK